MHISARILRNDASQMDRGAATLTARDIARRDRIASVGQGLMARHGSHSITMTAFAAALGHCVPTIRRHFADIDALLAYLLRQHLQFLAESLGAVPFGPGRPAALRAAYLAATRSVMGGLTEAHLLLVRDRGLLPEDERQPVEDTLQGLGFVLAGDVGPQILHLLDSPLFNADQIECMLHTLNAPAGRDAAVEHVPDSETPATQAGLRTCAASLSPAGDAERSLVDSLFRGRDAGGPVRAAAGADTFEARGARLAAERHPVPVPVADRDPVKAHRPHDDNNRGGAQSTLAKTTPARPGARQASRPAIPGARRKAPF